MDNECQATSNKYVLPIRKMVSVYLTQSPHTAIPPDQSKERGTGSEVAGT